MDEVPQRYYDTCAWVQHHYAQLAASTAKAASSNSSVWCVKTLPRSDPNLNLVLECFPPHANSSRASATATSLANSAAQHRPGDVDKETLENWYNRLLLRIADDIGCSDANK
ncbi:hypothetical protein LSCM1_00340 [Leishmania martiniquensis]|uniref:Uncharacterized protein n=1 Tax=Leishmania martiniquensis TaxID=1580590 RepID=A0A836GFA4_9TRYP|nr:hypothetical protein LSCM1_00340 [Leishmania martiniquensis]